MKHLSIFLSLLFCIEGRELKFVQAISRHGHRAPWGHAYPLDPYTEDYWPRGWDQLTTLGMRQVRELGEFFKTRYGNFLSPGYNRSEVYVQSSNVDRALESAQSFLYGLYPATTANNTAFDQNDYQPIAVHATSAGEDDYLCYFTHLNCPIGANLATEYTDDINNYYNKVYAEFYDFLSGATGFANFSSLMVPTVCNSNNEVEFGYTELQPAWRSKVWPQYDNKTSDELLVEISNGIFVVNYGTRDASKYYAGYAVNFWVETALAVAAGTQTSPSKLRLFSSHDTVQMGFTSTMGMKSWTMPTYASCFIMEVYEEDNGDHTVEFYYRNETNVEPYRFKPDGCGDPCLVSKLPSIYADVMIKTKNDVKTKCGLQEQTCENSDSSSSNLPFLQLLIVLFMYYAQFNFCNH